MPSNITKIWSGDNLPERFVFFKKWLRYGWILNAVWHSEQERGRPVSLLKFSNDIEQGYLIGPADSYVLLSLKECSIIEKSKGKWILSNINSSEIDNGWKTSFDIREN